MQMLVSLPCSCRHDTPSLLRSGLHTTALMVMAHAKVMADLMCHGGSRPNGQFRMVLEEKII